MRLLAIIGSLRRASYNRMVFRAVLELLPEGASISEAPIRDVPLYDDDLRLEQGYPEPVRRLRELVAAADAVLFITPEYNFSVPGVLKNAIDWASRPPDQPFKDKPVAIMGASTGMIGTARMQYHLRQSMVFVEALPLARPEVMIPFAADKFDEEGHLTDGRTREAIRTQLEALVSWTRRVAR